jgi:DNA-binding FrmR family transcriptional regulator
MNADSADIGTAEATPTASSEDELVALRRRLRRIAGQVLGIDTMVADHRPCDEILVQLSAVQGALRAAGLQVLARHTRDTLTDAATGTKSAADAADELTTLTNFLTHG